MKIKNVNLKWNTLRYNWNTKKIKPYNILGGNFVEILAKNIKKHKIENREQLKEFLTHEFKYYYWSKSENEILVGNLFAESYPDKLEKIDIWYQIEMNFDLIIDYIIREMKLFQKEK